MDCFIASYPNYPNCRIWVVWGYYGLLYQPYFSWFNPVLPNLLVKSTSLYRLNKEVTATLCFASTKNHCSSLIPSSWRRKSSKSPVLLVETCWILIWSDKNIFKLVWYFCKFSQFLHRIFQLRLFQEPLPVDLVPGGSRARPRWAVTESVTESPSKPRLQMLKVGWNMI